MPCATWCPYLDQGSGSSVRQVERDWVPVQSIRFHFNLPSASIHLSLFLLIHFIIHKKGNCPVPQNPILPQKETYPFTFSSISPLPISFYLSLLFPSIPFRYETTANYVQKVVFFNFVPQKRVLLSNLGLWCWISIYWVVWIWAFLISSLF